MSQRQKNIRQLIILAVLVSITAIVALVGSREEGFDYDRKVFTLDENTVITTVILDGNDFQNVFEYYDGVWEVNDTYLMDQGMRDVFFALLSSVEVKRPVASIARDSIRQFLIEEGVRVCILNNADTIKSFIAGGNEEMYQSYFMDPRDSQPYLVHIPGYQSYLSGIFYARENDWRSRYIWDFDWTNLRKLRVDFVKTNDSLVFEYSNEFIGVRGVGDLDTAGMMNYLENIAYLQTNKYLSDGEIPAYDDAIGSNNPLIIIYVEQIGDKETSLRLYPQPEGKQYIPGVLNDSQKVLFRQDVFNSFRAERQDFEARN